MTLRIDEYELADFDALHELDLACYPPGISYTRRTLKWFLAMRGSECLVAKSGENSAGVLGFIIAEHEGAGGHIITLDVAPGQPGAAAWARPCCVRANDGWRRGAFRE